MKKLFISHASEDKDDFVRALAEGLKPEFDVWYDDYQLVVGMSLLEEISRGLATCDYGVVVLSPSFFSKNWPQQELNGLFALEEKNRKVILPVWKDIEKAEILQYSPILADRVAAMERDGVGKVVADLKRAVEYFERGRSVETADVGLSRLRTVLQRKAEKERSDGIISSERGVLIGRNIGDATVRLLSDQIRSITEKDHSLGIRIDGPKNGGFGLLLGVFCGPFYLHAEYQNDAVNSGRLARLIMTLGMRTGGSFSGLSPGRYSLFVDLNDEVFWLTEDQKTLFSPEQLVDHWITRLANLIEKRRADDQIK